MKFKLDEIDYKVLDLLIDNSRIPYTDIAKKLLISAGTVHVRIKKMEDAGIISGPHLNWIIKNWVIPLSLIWYFLLRRPI